MNQPFKETEDAYIVDIEVLCSECGGTGLYVGMAERDGAAVVCYRCEGTGKSTFKRTFKKFTKRQHKEGVERVYHTSGGYCISAHDVKPVDAPIIQFSKFGVKYEQWLTGLNPRPIEDLHCPYMHTQQRMQNSDHEANALYKERCSDNLSLGGHLSDCKLNHDKAQCWRRYYEIVGKL